jgi:hypothetical protein
MGTQYIRVVLAATEENKARVEAALELLIEADEVVDGFPSMGVAGAYVSEWYDDRVEAIEGEWSARPRNPDDTISDDILNETMKLDEELEEYYKHTYE